jgi:hypothetical protein
MANQDISINVGLGSGFFGAAANLFVDGPGRYWRRQGVKNSFRTIQKAVDASRAGTVIFVAPGQYDETVTIPGTHGGNLTIVGVGGRGAAFIEPSTEDAGGMVCHAPDVSLVNLGVAGEDSTSAVALTVTGARFRAERCKFEGGLTQLTLGPGTVAQEAAGSHGDGADAFFDDCEFCWGTNGVILKASDYGAVTQARFRRCKFYNLSAAAFEETGGTASIRFRDLLVEECVFMPNEGVAPTKYLSLNDDNGNDGVVAGCIFPTAINSGLNLVSTKVLWVANRHSGGISTAQPS